MGVDSLSTQEGLCKAYQVSPWNRGQALIARPYYEGTEG